MDAAHSSSGYVFVVYIHFVYIVNHLLEQDAPILLTLNCRTITFGESSATNDPFI